MGGPQKSSCEVPGEALRKLHRNLRGMVLRFCYGSVSHNTFVRICKQRLRNSLTRGEAINRNDSVCGFALGE
jgi:hypothetical protein